ncbi:MAG: hypothetical protein NTZ50_12690 [Chloroflexi bacterium]|nr:hypothetical protein [Chloroflexota bacterium]
MLFAKVQRFRLNMSAEGAIRSGVLALSSEGAVASQPGAQHRRCAALGAGSAVTRSNGYDARGRVISGRWRRTRRTTGWGSGTA